MAEKSSFFNSIGGDRTYRAEDWAAYFATFVSNGVVLREDAALAVTADAGSMSVTLGAGRALINGYRYENTAVLSLALGTAHASLNRIDAVMIRWNRANRAMAACVVAGTPAAVPAAPAPTRSADVYELCVAQVYVAAGATSVAQSMMTDRRLDSALCGVATMIGDLDTSTLYAQIQAELAGFKAGEEAAFAAWFALVEDILDGDVAGNLLNLINQYRARRTTVILRAANWIASENVFTQTVTVLMVPAHCVLHAGPEESNRDEYGDADVHVSVATAGSVTFTAAFRPTLDLTVNLAVSEVDAL